LNVTFRQLFNDFLPPLMARDKLYNLKQYFFIHAIALDLVVGDDPDAPLREYACFNMAHIAELIHTSQAQAEIIVADAIDRKLVRLVARPPQARARIAEAGQ
jgi:hypothetical protein